MDINTNKIRNNCIGIIWLYDKIINNGVSIDGEICNKLDNIMTLLNLDNISYVDWMILEGDYNYLLRMSDQYINYIV